MKYTLFFISFFYVIIIRANNVTFGPTVKSSVYYSNGYISYIEDFDQNGIKDIVYMRICPTVDGKEIDSNCKLGHYCLFRDSTLKIIDSTFIFSPQFRLKNIYDFNSDQYPDLIGYLYDSLCIFYNDKARGFNIVKIHDKDSFNFFSFDVIDLNNDHKWDLVGKGFSRSVTGSVNGSYLVFFQEDSFKFKPCFLPRTYTPTKVLTSSLNGDTLKDIVYFDIYYPNNKLYISHQRSDFQFDNGIKYMPDYIQDIVLGDVNHDGKDDIIAALYSGTNKVNGIAIYYQLATGGFSNTYSYYPMNDSGIGKDFSFNVKNPLLYVKDLNCDGYIEIFRWKDNIKRDLQIFDTKIDTNLLFPSIVKSKFLTPLDGYSSAEFSQVQFFDFNSDNREDIKCSVPFFNFDYKHAVSFVLNTTIPDGSNITSIKAKIDTACVCYPISNGKPYEYTLTPIVYHETYYINRDTFFLSYAKSFYIDSITKGKIYFWFKQWNVSNQRVEYDFIKNSISFDTTFYYTSNSSCFGTFSDSLHTQNIISIIVIDTPYKYISNKVVQWHFYTDTTYTPPSNINSPYDFHISIFPNPVNHELNIEHIGASKKTVRFYTLDMQQIQLPEFNPNSYDCSNLTNGIYFISLELDDEVLKQKFIVQH